jgi:hypothetical protein
MPYALSPPVSPRTSAGWPPTCTYLTVAGADLSTLDPLEVKVRGMKTVGGASKEAYPVHIIDIIF